MCLLKLWWKNGLFQTSATFWSQKFENDHPGCVSSIVSLDQRDHWCQWFLRSTSVWDAFRKHNPDLPACTEIVCMNVLKEQYKKTIICNLCSRIQANNNNKQTNQITSDIAFSKINIFSFFFLFFTETQNLEEIWSIRSV